jgi:hypothetical protein
MAAGRYSFTIEQGSTLNFELQYKNSSGSAINLSGYSGKMQIKSNYADNSPTIYLTLSSSLQPDGTGLNFSGSNGSTPTASGSIGVFISAATSSLLTFDTALYDLEIASGSIVTRILEGQVKLSKEVTR